MRRLHRNHGGYQGERLEVERWQEDLEHAARRAGWRLQRLPVEDQAPLLVLQRGLAQPGRRFYLSAGIHGDEPAGPLALLELVREDHWPAEAGFWIAPCLNPVGCARGTRTDEQGVDLNRDYRERRSARVRAHVQWLGACPRFERALLLHEDWEAGGFYLYELASLPPGTVAERIIQAVQPICPIDPADRIDGRPARGGIIRPEANLAERRDWPEAFYLVAQKTAACYTLEAPSDYPLPVRIRALKAAVQAGLASAQATG